MAKHVDYYVSLNSPWTYLGSKRFEAMAERRKRWPMAHITAHEKMEKRRRRARTAFPTTPACPNTVQICTSVR